MKKILVVDDEEAARYGIRRALENRDTHILEAPDADTARVLIKQHRPDLMLADINMPGEDGISLLKSLEAETHRPLTVVITAYGTAKVAVEAMKAGAYDYIIKPFEVEELRLAVNRALERLALLDENRSLKQQVLPDGQFGRMIGKGAVMRRLFETAAQAGETDVTILIQGESGTGKELLAREIHERSGRAKKPFVAVNCAALPDALIESELFGHEKGAFTGANDQRKGKFEQAHGGTIFLDEIGDMNALTQAKVLRVLEDRTIQRLGGNATITVDVRVVSATHKNLASEVEGGRFRQDLLYRLKVVTLDLPPLRARMEDLPLLIGAFCRIYAARHNKPLLTVSPEALALLKAHFWPGNLRELRNVIEGCVVLNRSGCIEVGDLPEEIRRPQPASLGLDSSSAGSTALAEMPYKEAKRQFEIQYLSERLKRNQGNISRTAAEIGLHRQSLQQKLKELGIGR
ncbi:MAG: sigma-54 dependent transcriptional regulator [Acidobacteriota bacterium]